MTNPTLECMHTPSCIGNLTFGHECCRLHKYRCSYIYNFFMHAFHSIFCFWLFRVQFHLSFMPCSGVHGIFHHALTRSGPSLMCFRETTVTPPDAHIGEHALTLDFRALEKILKDVCSFDFCLIHVSWFCCWGLGGVVGCDLMGSNWSVWGFVRCICLCREQKATIPLSLSPSLSLQNKSGYWWCMAMQLPMVSGVLQVLRIEKQSFYCCITSDVKSLW